MFFIQTLSYHTLLSKDVQPCVVSIIHGKENIKSDFFNLELPARKNEFEEVKIKTQIDFLI